MEQKVIQLEKVIGLVRNAKDHDIGGIIVAIRRFGFIHPIVINKTTGRMIAGHGRVEALRIMKLGREELKPDEERKPRGIIGDEYQWFVPCYEAQIEESEEEAASIALNRLEELGGWDENQLVKVLSDLAAKGKEMLDGIGFDADDLDRMITDMQIDKEEEEVKEDEDSVATIYGVLAECVGPIEQSKLIIELKGQGYKARGVMIDAESRLEYGS